MPHQDPTPRKSPLVRFAASHEAGGRGWRLFVYLISSYAISWLAHVPVHHGFSSAVIPAVVPWAIAAMIAVWQHAQRLSLMPAWITLAAASTFFILPHILRF